MRSREYIIVYDSLMLDNSYLQILSDHMYAFGSNPHMASTFKTKKEAKEWLIDNTNLTLDNISISVRSEVLVDFDKWFEAGGFNTRIPVLDPTISLPYDEKVHTKEDVFAWRVKVATALESTYRYDHYITWPYLSEFYTYLFDARVRYASKTDFTKKSLFQISVERDADDFETFEEEVKLAFKHTTCKEDGWKRMDIMDHDLSLSGIPYILYKNRSYRLMINKFNRTTQIGSSMGLKKLFETMKKSHYR